VDTDGGLANLVEWTKVAAYSRRCLVLENHDGHIADRDRGIEGLIAMGLELRQNDVGDDF